MEIVKIVADVRFWQIGPLDYNNAICGCKKELGKYFLRYVNMLCHQGTVMIQTALDSKPEAFLHVL